MGGRPTGSVYEKRSGEFISSQFKRLGLKPRWHIFRYQHKDSSKVSLSRNVYCFINNKSDSTIIIGAHYDHIGMGGELSRSLGKKDIHNGADDNASGVALLLGLAKNYHTWMNVKYNYVFVAYSAHEIGLFGSQNFSKLAIKRWENISLVLNFDMVGRMNSELKWVKLYGVNKLKPASHFFNQELYDLHYRTDNDTLLFQLDTKSFIENKITCLSISTGIHDDYHKISDDESKINYEGIFLIQQLTQQFLKTY